MEETWGAIETSQECCFFFFKQKTAYEIGLGIPAEPLFRSQQEQESEGILQSPAYHKRKPQRSDEHESGQRSEERRVGKECRSRGAADPQKRKAMPEEGGGLMAGLRSRAQDGSSGYARLAWGARRTCE